MSNQKHPKEEIEQFVINAGLKSREQKPIENSNMVYSLAVCLEYGYNITQDYKEAIKFYEIAAELGHTKAKIKMASYYFSTDKSGKWFFEYHKGFIMLREAAELNDKEAMMLLAQRYENYNSSDYNIKKAIVWYDKLIEQNDIIAIRNLAKIYERNRNIIRDKEIKYDVKKIIKLYEHGATLGCAKSMFRAAQYYYYNEENKDMKKCIELLEKASALNYREALLLLASCYENGIGVEKNLDKAKELSDKEWTLLFEQSESTPFSFV